MEKEIKIYISQFDEFYKVEDIIKEYNVGLEVVNFASAMVLDSKEKYIKELRECINKVKSISFHGPFSDLIPGSIDPEIRKITNMRFNQAYNIAKEFYAERIVYHTGCVPNTYWEKLWIENSKTFWVDFMKDKLQPMEVHIENVYEKDYMFISEIIEEVDNPNFSACLDIGHVNIFSNKSIDDWIKGLKNKIKHVHIHNNEGILDNHSGISGGKINMIKTLDNLKIYCPEASWTLEIFDRNQLIESLEFLKKHGFL